MSQYSPDDNRFDLRQILYNSSWTTQFKAIDDLVERHSSEQFENLAEKQQYKILFRFFFIPRQITMISQFSNLKSINDKVDNLLDMNKELIDEMLSDGHDWANDHVTSSRDDIEEVYNWITTNIKG